MNLKKTLIASAVLGATVAFSSAPLYAEDWQGETMDAWIDGKLETSYLLNTQLNNFDIDTEVENGRVTLSGMVASDAHKDLAEQIAQNIDGIEGVTNNLSVGERGDMEHEMSETDRNFMTAFYDGTIFVGLKSQYAVNDQLEALDINVDVENGEVTLNGRVENEAEKMLAEELALGYDHVTTVHNMLEVI